VEEGPELRDPVERETEVEALAREYATTFAFMSAGRWTGETRVGHRISSISGVSDAGRCRSMLDARVLLFDYRIRETWDENPIHTFDKQGTYWTEKASETELKEIRIANHQSEQLRHFLFMTDTNGYHSGWELEYRRSFFSLKAKARKEKSFAEDTFALGGLARPRRRVGR